ncbi:MAG: hypothetical protein ACPGUD_14615, partial [Parashewanella sp.]
YQIWARTVNNYGKSVWFGPVPVRTAEKSEAVEQLLQGTKFENYTWFAWADDDKGTGFTTDPAQKDSKKWLGIAQNKKLKTPSQNHQEYEWNKKAAEVGDVFTQDEQSRLDDVMAGRVPGTSEEMLSAQEALRDKRFNNELQTALDLLNRGINAGALGGETPAGAQSKADAAKASALQAAKADSNLSNNVTENNVTRIARPKGGSFQKGGFNVTGAIKVQLPVFFTSSMVSFYVDVFEYRSGKSFSVYVSGHNDAGSKKWHSVTAKIVGDEASNYTVRAGHENNKCCFWIAELSSKFHYPSITVRDVQISFAAYDITLWDDNWNVALVSSFGVVQNELRGNVVGNNVAQQKADIAKAQAIITANDDATTKANTARTQAVEDIAAGNFIAQQGLIKKLIANQALMNQVIAQFGQFGGLAAEAIAAKAVSTDKLHVLARNLVNNFSHTGERTGWSGNFPLVDHVHKGQTIKAMEVATSGNIEVFSEWFEIDHTKIYEINFTFYRVSGGATGSRYLGMNADQSLTEVIYNSSRTSGGDSGNFYFYYGDIANGEAKSIKAYIIGSEVDPASVPETDFSICKLKPATKKIRLRALSYYNNGITTVDRWINPSVTELGSGTITARQLIATQALFNIVKAQFAKFGGLTANELNVDSAFINKLISNRGLFDELKARIAVFGGLTANEIATGAVRTEHLAVGQTLQSPVINGGQVRLIGSNYMRVTSAAPFGPDNLVEWSGPKLMSGSNPNWSALRKANATTYVTDKGDAYFGGTLSAGVLRTSTSNPKLSSYANGEIAVEIGPFSTRGRTKTIISSFSFASSWTSSSSTSLKPSISWVLERRIGNGNWQALTSVTQRGHVHSHFEGEIGKYENAKSLNASNTFTDTTNSTSLYSYRIRITGYNNASPSSAIDGQMFSLSSSEE